MTVFFESKTPKGKASLEERMIQELAKLISFRSIVGANDVKKLCLEYIEKTFFSSSPLERIRGEVKDCPYLFLQHKNPKLLWFAHTDVVPGEEGQFTLQREGDILLGRGVKDMKGAILPFLLAYREACERGDVPPVSILLTSDEEIVGQTIPALKSAPSFATSVGLVVTPSSTPQEAISETYPTFAVSRKSFIGYYYTAYDRFFREQSIECEGLFGGATDTSSVAAHLLSHHCGSE